MPSVPIARFRVAVLLLVLALMPLRPMAQGPPALEDPEAYAVYAAVLQQRAKNDRDFARDIRLLQETRPPISRCGDKEFVGRGWQPAVAHFRQANAHRWLLAMSADLGLPYLLVTPSLLAPILKAVADDPSPRRGGGAGLGGRLLPASYIAFSAVGFNADQTFALVGDETRCNVLNTAGDGVLCGQGHVTPWEKIEGQWVAARNAGSCVWTH